MSFRSLALPVVRISTVFSLLVIAGAAEADVFEAAPAGVTEVSCGDSVSYVGSVNHTAFVPYDHLKKLEEHCTDIFAMSAEEVPPGDVTCASVSSCPADRQSPAGCQLDWTYSAASEVKLPEFVRIGNQVRCSITIPWVQGTVSCGGCADSEIRERGLPPAK